ncbi:unnamed protein product [Rotaria sordida]|uniref:Xaa-Pro dipeptidyl-peptidase-like domain-containing protein n=1 Tax=Rotaria sordida TaxID=392033 RepID=A0A818YXE4_9BILA|nr:unnamed protein product [Rotaria sordida]CAF3758855.1 unnamed protein product [Rotaria sordida]
MSDGVRLSASLSIPIPKHNYEKFSILFEYKPYRKDDNLFNFDQPNIFYLTRRGFIVTKVDIRDTGSSKGFLIEREYTIEELNHCEHVIQQLAKRPTALQPVFLAHASHDFYKNDIHYQDGIVHIDHYIVSIDQTNALSATTDYLTNQKWIKQ